MGVQALSRIDTAPYDPSASAGQMSDHAAEDFNIAKQRAEAKPNSLEGYNSASEANEAAENEAARAAIQDGTAIAQEKGKGGAAFEQGCHEKAGQLREQAANETGGAKQALLNRADDLDAFAKDPAGMANDTSGQTLAKAGDEVWKNSGKTKMDQGSSASGEAGSPSFDDLANQQMSVTNGPGLAEAMRQVSEMMGLQGAQ